MNDWSTEFRKRTKFDEPGTLLGARAKYLLFFVTKVAGLRNDTTPKVLKERL